MSEIFYHISILSSLILLTRCGTVTANNAEESYRRWAGQPIPKEVKVLKGHYWQSGHWSREYTVYLKLRPTKSWWSEFVKQNKLVSDTIQDFQFGDAPKWFIPPKGCAIWKMRDKLQDSRYMRDTLTGICYIYETQL